MCVLCTPAPHLLLCNSPGTCVPMAVSTWLLTRLYLMSTTLVMVESMCRVRPLSLTATRMVCGGMSIEEVKKATKDENYIKKEELKFDDEDFATEDENSIITEGQDYKFNVPENLSRIFVL